MRIQNNLPAELNRNERSRRDVFFVAAGLLVFSLSLLASRAYETNEDLVVLALVAVCVFAGGFLSLIGLYLQDAGRRKVQDIRSMESVSVALRGLWCAVFVPVLFMAGCGQPTAPAPQILPPGEWHTFEGTWSASGTRQTLNLEANHRASILDLTGSLLLTGDRGLGVGFRAEAIGFSDNLAGMQGRCVWTDERGDKVYSELKGESVGAGNLIEGTFLGGTGRFVGVTGQYSFRWQYVVESEDVLSGRAVDLKGRVRFTSTASTPLGEHSK